jgi:hypothetical protein
MKYLVTIKATIRKTLEIEAENERDATEAAHEEFTVECDGGDEYYNQETLYIEQVKGESK